MYKVLQKEQMRLSWRALSRQKAGIRHKNTQKYPLVSVSHPVCVCVLTALYEYQLFGFTARQNNPSNIFKYIREKRPNNDFIWVTSRQFEESEAPCEGNEMQFIDPHVIFLPRGGMCLWVWQDFNALDELSVPPEIYNTEKLALSYKIIQKWSLWKWLLLLISLCYMFLFFFAQVWLLDNARGAQKLVLIVIM